jgi:cytochrome c-type biogenesis protein CcmH
MIWLLIALVALGALVAIAWPLLRRPTENAERAAYDLTIFQDQLKEVDRDLERGVLNEAEAGAARLEIQRRIIAAQKAPGEKIDDDKAWLRRTTVAAMFVTVPLVAGLIYVQVGAPLQTPNRTVAANEGGTSGGVDIDQIVSMLEAKVQQSPDDKEGLGLLAMTYSRLGRYQDAVELHRRLTELEPNADSFASYGEALGSLEGKVGKDAHDAFVRALSFDRTDPRARFYLGQEQAELDQPENAIAIWRDLTASAPADAGWVPMVRERMATLAQMAGVAPMSIDPKHPLDLLPADEEAKANAQAAAQAPAVAAQGAPDQAASGMQEQIKGMVAGLAARLESTPDDFNGWMMLGRSYTVLKNFDGAKNAYAKAVALKPAELEPRLQHLAALMVTTDLERPGPLPQDIDDAANAVIRIDPKQSEALYVAGLVRAKAGDKAGAKSFWDRARASMPNDSPLKDELETRMKALE